MLNEDVWGWRKTQLVSCLGHYEKLNWASNSENCLSGIFSGECNFFFTREEQTKTMTKSTGYKNDGGKASLQWLDTKQCILLATLQPGFFSEIIGYLNSKWWTVNNAVPSMAVRGFRLCSWYGKTCDFTELQLYLKSWAGRNLLKVVGSFALWNKLLIKLRIWQGELLAKIVLCAFKRNHSIAFPWSKVLNVQRWIPE